MQLIPGGGSAADVVLPLISIPTKAATKVGQKVAEKIIPVPNIPPPPELPPVPTREDPEISAARERQRQADLRRRGRRATILTGGRGVEDELGVVNRPQAGATRLGQTRM